MNIIRKLLRRIDPPKDAYFYCSIHGTRLETVGVSPKSEGAGVGVWLACPMCFAISKRMPERMPGPVDMTDLALWKSILEDHGLNLKEGSN